MFPSGPGTEINGVYLSNERDDHQTTTRGSFECVILFLVNLSLIAIQLLNTNEKSICLILVTVCSVEPQSFPARPHTRGCVPHSG
jgi:hypothetical protein